MRKWSGALVAVLMLATALAGCAEDAGVEGEVPTGILATHPVSGRVLTPAFNPLQGAQVLVGQGSMCTLDHKCTFDLREIRATTDAGGAFVLEGIWEGQATLFVTHPDYMPTNVTVHVPGPAVNITLTPINRIVPYQEAFPFKGYIECGAEYLIITPSCDTLIKFAGGPELFQDDSVFDVLTSDFWQTLVLDVFFEDADHPGIAGLRVSAYADDADSELLEYERITQAWGEGPFTLRLEPGRDYGDAVPAPIDSSDIRFEFYPHGHAGDTPFLGVGAAFRLEFEAVATVFYHEAAPDGWTLLA